ncbi:MAG: hybrid sensor histidine kinase/response regulator [Chloroflexota bacterium]
MVRRKANPGFILLVDDVIQNLHMLTDMLKNQGHEVVIALNGKEALEKVDEKRPDLILLDIQMPGMNGYEVCEKIKDDEDTEDIPIIFLSALSDTKDIVKGFEVGGVDYVSKPFKYREVLARVESQLALAQQREEIEALREQDKQQFDTLSELRSKFLHGTVHDLKSPLTGMTLYAQKLRGMPPENKEEMEEVADGITSASRKMQRLVTDILDIAQIQIANQVRLIDLPVNPVVKDSVKNLKVIAESQKIDLSAHVPDETLSYPIDKNYFERMIDNLVSNAIKYTPDGGKVTVTMTIYDEGSFEIAVQDTGLGIPEDAIPNLFDAFYRVKKKEHASRAGSGLGLSMVQAIVEQHGGTIKVASVEGEGSTFTIYFPKI